MINITINHPLWTLIDILSTSQLLAFFLAIQDGCFQSLPFRLFTAVGSWATMGRLMLQGLGRWSNGNRLGRIPFNDEHIRKRFLLFFDKIWIETFDVFWCNTMQECSHLVLLSWLLCFSFFGGGGCCRSLVSFNMWTYDLNIFSTKPTSWMIFFPAEWCKVAGCVRLALLQVQVAGHAPTAGAPEITGTSATSANGMDIAARLVDRWSQLLQTW